MMKRIRLKQPIFVAPKRNRDYFRLRWYWLVELYNIRAKRKLGTASKKDIKVAQRELVRIRKDEHK